MKGKFFIIALLLALLVFTVYQMMQYEESIREERIIRLYVEDDSKPLLSKFPVEELNIAALNSDYYFVADGDYFKSLKTKYNSDGKQLFWENIFLKGVNLGVAVPGKFPAEFSLTFDEYLEWLELIGKMNANVVRIYTILPPEFYEAFSYYNLHHQNKPLYLMQGVWAKIPNDDNYYNEDYTREFQKEIIDVIDVIHGKAVLKEQSGKASGTYATDVSNYVVALLLGREWEPSAVYKTNHTNKINHYIGDFIIINDGNAMEAWLAKMMDFTVLYETQTYKSQHPVSFVNWLPLDPMYHNTEIIENKKVREYDNDLEKLDFTKFHSTELFFPGIFAAYHAYPYYPDYIYLQESYSNAINYKGEKDNYFGYLQDLKQHTQGLPLIIAEYGLPSSRGNSHYAPYGFNQGGHSEAEQAKLSLILTKDIYYSNCAGAIFFEWTDEWFKHNWLVMDFEQPFEDRKIWHNMENPEQNFGIYALESRTKTIDGNTDDWDKNNFKGNDIIIAADADPGYFYISSIIPELDFNKNNLYLAIDIFDKEKGDHKLPFSDKEFENGFEFLLEFKNENNARILVDEPYSVFTDIYNEHIPVYASKKNNNGLFIKQKLLTNRSRVTLLGEKTDSIIHNRSPLIFGNSSLPETSNADWFWNDSTKMLELRLDWHLINVSDPAKRYVLDDIEGTPAIEYSKTDAVKMYVFVTDKKNNILTQYPANEPYSYIWDEWEVPVYKARLKPVYYSLQKYFKELKPDFIEIYKRPETDGSFEITDFYNNKKGAISISFDNAGFSQYRYAIPVLHKYHIKGSFGVIPELLDKSPGLYDIDEGVKLKRLSVKEIREIAGNNNEIAYQPLNAEFSNQENLVLLKQKVNAEINSLHLKKNSISDNSVKSSIVFTRKTPDKNVLFSNVSGISYAVVNTHLSQIKLDSIFKTNKNQWTILVYHNLFVKDQTRVNNISKEKFNEYFIDRSDFDKQIRLARNTDYWIAPEANVFKYLKEKKSSKIETTQYKNFIFLKVINTLDRNIFNQPLTVEFTTDTKIIKVEGSAADGIYNNRTGSIFINVFPNREVKIEIIE